LPGADVSVIDINPARRDLAEGLGARFVAAADYRPCGGADVVFHASASAPGLALALEAAGLEATVVELSWYGAGDVPAPLGGAFRGRWRCWPTTASMRSSTWTSRSRTCQGRCRQFSRPAQRGWASSSGIETASRPRRDLERAGRAPCQTPLRGSSRRRNQLE